MSAVSGIQVVTVFGGSGFIGRHVVRRLAAQGRRVRVAVRDPEGAMFLKTAGDVGQIVPQAVDITQRDAVARALDGADAAINLVGILSPWGSQTFERVHVDGARHVAEAARDGGLKALVHMSAICDPATGAAYARSKVAAEAAVRAACPEATILKPSVVFGPEDDFFNRFADMARFSPALPVFGGPFPPRLDRRAGFRIDVFGDGGPRMQPVYVGDVAEAVARSLDRPDARGETFELGGPRAYGFKQLMEMVLAHTGRRRLLVPVPFGPMRLMAMVLERLPQAPVTRDQLKMLAADNVVTEGVRTLADLEIEAMSVGTILPTYLRRYRSPLAQRPRLA